MNSAPIVTTSSRVDYFETVNSMLLRWKIETTNQKDIQCQRKNNQAANGNSNDLDRGNQKSGRNMRRGNGRRQNQTGGHQTQNQRQEPQ
jgi:hypothetical protein